MIRRLFGSAKLVVLVCLDTGSHQHYFFGACAQRALGVFLEI